MKNELENKWKKHEGIASFYLPQVLLCESDFYEIETRSKDGEIERQKICFVDWRLVRFWRRVDNETMHSDDSKSGEPISCETMPKPRKKVLKRIVQRNVPKLCKKDLDKKVEGKRKRPSFKKVKK